MVAAITSTGASAPIAHPIATTSAAPATTSSRETTRLRRSPITTLSTVPRIGVISGATIIAPMTVAVESATTPAEAMTAARVSRIQYRVSFRARSGPSKSSPPVMRVRSASEMVGIDMRVRRASPFSG